MDAPNLPARIDKNVVIQDVLHAVSAAAFASAKDHVKNNPPRFWSERSIETFSDDMVLFTFFKDLKNMSYHDLESKYWLGYHIAHSTLNWNVPLTRECLKSWAENHIVVGTLDEWQHIASQYKFGQPVKNTCLWMDSTEFRLEGARSTSRKSPYWSYKLNSPGVKFMFVLDARGCIRKVWGPFSPKLYDSDFFNANKDEFERLFEGATIIADNHFAKARKICTKVKFLCNIAKKPVGSRATPTEDSDNLEFINLTQEQQRYNEAHRKARARVELPFGLIKNKFTSLDKPWKENIDQLTCTVLIASAVVNFLLH